MNSKQDFTNGSIPKKLIGFMIPILGALILQAMYGAVDLMIVGQFGTTEGISAVTTGSGIMNLVTFVICGLTASVTIIMGNYIGEGNPHKNGKLLGSAIFFFAIVSVITTVIMIILAKPLAMLMQAPTEALDLTVTYIRICGAGYIFIVFYNVISAIFRGMGDSRMPLIFVAIACVVNIAGDLFLVAYLHMNVSGAAIATVLAQGVSVIISLIIIVKKQTSYGFNISLQDIKYSEEIPHFLKIGGPLAFQELLTNITFLAICAFINRMGLECSSGYGVAQKIQAFVMLIPVSIMQSMSPFVSQNVGANKEIRAKKAMFCGMITGGSIGVVIAYFAYFHGNLLAQIFTPDAAVILRAWEFLRGFALEAIVTCILFSFMGYFSGHFESIFIMFLGVAQSVIVRLPMSYIMSIRKGATLFDVGLAAPTATIFGILICIVYYIYYQKKLNLSKKTEMQDI